MHKIPFLAIFTIIGLSAQASLAIDYSTGNNDDCETQSIEYQPVENLDYQGELTASGLPVASAQTQSSPFNFDQVILPIELPASDYFAASGSYSNERMEILAGAVGVDTRTGETILNGVNVKDAVSPCK